MKEEIFLANLCLLIDGYWDGGSVLLGRKLRKIGRGRPNAPGGGVKKGETIPESTVREVFEETGGKTGRGGLSIKAEDLTLVAVIDFHNQPKNADPFICRMFVYSCFSWDGRIVENDEMDNFAWLPFCQVPYKSMMPADEFWLRPVLEGKKIRAQFFYGPNQKTMLRPGTVTIVSALEEER